MLSFPEALYKSMREMAFLKKLKALLVKEYWLMGNLSIRVWTFVGVFFSFALSFLFHDSNKDDLPTG